MVIMTYVQGIVKKMWRGTPRASATCKWPVECRHELLLVYKSWYLTEDLCFLTNSIMMFLLSEKWTTWYQQYWCLNKGWQWAGGGGLAKKGWVLPWPSSPCHFKIRPLLRTNFDPVKEMKHQSWIAQKPMLLVSPWPISYLIYIYNKMKKIIYI